MKISIVGTGYVGLVTGACFARMGNSVICVDSNNDKIEKLRSGVIPIYEPGLDIIVAENLRAGSLKFTTGIKEALDETIVCIIAVGTPMGEDGSADLKHVIDVAGSIGKNMSHDMIIVDKSTVPVGTAEMVRDTIKAELKKRKADYKFSVASNPEFLKEGNAIDDFMKPERVIIGTDDPDALNIMKELYAPFTHSHDRFIAMDIRSAELTKYAANAMLATKISFMNELANICERVGADINMVRVGIGSDSRIGYSFIYPGCGFGGSCFPKDVQALIKTSMDNDYRPEIISAVQRVNERQKYVLVEKIISRFGRDLKGRTVAVWGLSFKPETDDMREASSITIINGLTELGAQIKAYDPRAIEQARNIYLNDNKHVHYFDGKYSVLKDADMLVLITEWKEFRSPDFAEMARRMKNRIIFDGRNQYNSEKLEAIGFEYYQIGVADLPRE
jgi:UDPglucose 6-dehydrogenase